LIVNGVPFNPGTTTVFVGAAFACEHPAQDQTRGNHGFAHSLVLYESIPRTWSHAGPRRLLFTAVLVGAMISTSHLPEASIAPSGLQSHLTGLGTGS